MSDFGLTPNGFVVKRLDDIKTDLETDIKATFGEVRVDPDSVMGQLIGTFVKPLADVWELMEAVYHSQYPASAEGIALDNVVQFNGLTRLASTPSHADVVMYSDTLPTTVPEGTLIAVVDTGEEFSLESDTTIALDNVIHARIAITGVHIEDYTVQINAQNYTYSCPSGALPEAAIAAALAVAINADPTNGITASDGSTAPDQGVLDIKVTDLLSAAAVSIIAGHLDYEVIGSNGHFSSSSVGAVIAVSGTLTEIRQPVSGLTAVNNLLDAVLGRAPETDIELRERRRDSLQVVGAATVDAIRSRILQQVEGVTSVSVFENNTDDFDPPGDPLGRPPHSVHCVVVGGDDAAVAEKIWQVKAAGIATYGDTLVEVEDSMGMKHNIRFDRPTVKYFWARMDITKYGEEDFPLDGAIQIQNAIAAYGQTLQVGNDIIYQRLFAPIYSVPGVADAALEIAITDDLTPPSTWYQVNQSISATGIADFDTDRITVNVL